jgi:chitosanase
MITAIQKKTAQAIVNIFETSSVLGDYGSVTLIPGDTGHLTFGRSQTTLGSGNLALLLQQYCGNPGARFAASLQDFLPRFVAKDLTLDNEDHLHNILRATADDPLMRETQDSFFDLKYWQVAERSAQRIGITTPLGVAVVYDSTVHGSLDMIRKRTTDAVGEAATCGEQAWIQKYVQTRRNWLSTSPRKDLQSTVYRMDAFQRLIDQNQWGLQLPLVVRGLEISILTLNATPSGCYDGPTPGTRIIALQAPLLRGLDVRLVQLGLSAQGVDVKADGVFGRTSGDFIKQYQASKGLPVTGVVDTSLIATLIA